MAKEWLIGLAPRARNYNFC